MSTVTMSDGTPLPLPGKFSLSQHSLDKLEGVHPDLVAVVHLAIRLTAQDFAVICGLRTLEQEKVFVADGRSKTLNSRHIPGLAVDLVAYTIGNGISWAVPLFFKIEAAMLQAAKLLSVDVQWGADWNQNGDTQDETFRDYDHFQLHPKFYPNNCVHECRSTIARAFLDTLSG